MTHPTPNPLAEAQALVAAARAERRADAAEEIKRTRANEAATRELGRADLAKWYHRRARELAHLAGKAHDRADAREAHALRMIAALAKEA